MKNLNPIVIFLFSLLLFLPGCDLIKGVFEAGFWAAIILIVAVIALIIWGLSSLSTSTNDSDLNQRKNVSS